MTIVATYIGVWGGLLAADSRVTTCQSGNVTYRDVCQKAALLGSGDGWIGFAGDIATACKFLSVALPLSAREGLSWLNSHEGVKTLLEEAKVSGDDPQACFLALFRDKEPRQGLPILRCHSVAFDSQQTIYRQTHLGFDAIGSGETHFDEVKTSLNAIELANMLQEGQVRSTTVWFAHQLYRHFGRGQEPTVGGLFQLHYITQQTLSVVPYERWVRLGRGLGTYVQMLVKRGRWTQVHAPTKREVPLDFPCGSDFVQQDWSKSRRFDIRYMLGQHSPGVVPEPDEVTEYRFLGGEIWSMKLPPQFRQGPV